MFDRSKYEGHSEVYIKAKEEAHKRMIERKKQYHKSESYKEYRKEYEKRDSYKEYKREYQKEYYKRKKLINKNLIE